MDDVVVAVKVEVCAAALLIETEAGERLQVAGLVAPEGELVTEQVRATVPVNEPAGVMEMEEVLPVVAPGATLILPLLESVKLLLVLGGCQNPEQPTAKATINGTAASNGRRHFPVIIAVALASLPFHAPATTWVRPGDRVLRHFSRISLVSLFRRNIGRMLLKIGTQRHSIPLTRLIRRGSEAPFEANARPGPTV